MILLNPTVLAKLKRRLLYACKAIGRAKFRPASAAEVDTSAKYSSAETAAF